MSNREAQLRAFAAANPTHDGDNWAGLCSAAIFRADAAAISYDPALKAYNAAKAAGTINTDPSQSTIGSKHYWAGAGGDGHVAEEVHGGGRYAFMASTHITEALASNLGFASVADYNARSNGMTYLGWSEHFGINDKIGGADDLWTNPADPPQPAPAWALNPQDADWARIQQALKNRGRYSGPVDGDPGINTFKGVQITIQNVGYTGPVDGDIEAVGCHLIQVYAAKFGDYSGPIDSILGPNSWAGFALGLERP